MLHTSDAPELQFQDAAEIMRREAGGVCRWMFCQRKLDAHCIDAFVTFAACVPFPSAADTAAVCGECAFGKTDEQLAFTMRDTITPGSHAQIVQAATVSGGWGMPNFNEAPPPCIASEA